MGFLPSLVFLILFKILLPSAFEDSDAIQFPAFEGAGVNAEEVGILFACQTEFFAFLTDLLALVEVKEHIIVVKQICDGDFVELGELLHMFDRIVVLAAFLIGGVGRAIDAQEVGNFTLK